MNLAELYRSHQLLRLRLLAALVEINWKEAELRRFMAGR